MEMKGIFYFDPSDMIYNDHFPGNPVVPGSVIIDAFLKAAKEAGFSKRPFIIENFRFREFVSPGEHAFIIQLQSDELKCRLFQNGSDETEILVTGTIKRWNSIFPEIVP